MTYKNIIPQWMFQLNKKNLEILTQGEWLIDRLIKDLHANELSDINLSEKLNIKNKFRKIYHSSIHIIKVDRNIKHK